MTVRKKTSNTLMSLLLKLLCKNNINEASPENKFLYRGSEGIKLVVNVGKTTHCRFEQ